MFAVVLRWLCYLVVFGLVLVLTYCGGLRLIVVVYGCVWFLVFGFIVCGVMWFLGFGLLGGWFRFGISWFMLVVYCGCVAIINSVVMYYSL